MRRDARERNTPLSPTSGRLVKRSRVCPKMPALKNLKHEKFAHGLVSGLSATKAYVFAGYKEAGARASSARLLTLATVQNRVQELREEIAGKLTELAITNANARLQFAQERWDALREVAIARKTGDYARLIQSGIIVRREKVIGSGAKARVIEEYEVDTGWLDACNNLEKHVAIQTGEWTEKRDLNVKGEVATVSLTLAQMLSPDELRSLEQRALAAQQQKQLLPAGTVVEGEAEPQPSQGER